MAEGTLEVRKACSSKRAAKQEAWKRILSEHKRSGLSARQFCKAKGIPVQTFYWWKRRLSNFGGNGKPESKKRKSLVPVVVFEPNKSGDGSSGKEPFELLLKDGVVLRVPQDFEGNALESLLRSLSSLC